MSSHSVVYLDQNYLSYMAKARIGSITGGDQAKFWESLFDDLKKAVLADKIACPESEFHMIEAMYDRRLEDPIRQIIDELSWGLRFCQRDDMVESQSEEAAYKFLGKNKGSKKPWLGVFTSNPQASVRSRAQDILGLEGRISVHFSLSDELVEHDRQLKSEFVKNEELHRKLNKVCRDWNDEVLAQKMSLIDSLFLGGQNIGSIDKQRQLSRLWRKLGEIGIKLSDIATLAKFLKSDELLSIPYINICGSINAAINKHYPSRKWQGSDLYDILTLSAVLPYCDIITTDLFMQEILVSRLHFDDKYKAKIFSAAKTDRLAFGEFIRGLQ